MDSILESFGEIFVLLSSGIGHPVQSLSNEPFSCDHPLNLVSMEIGEPYLPGEGRRLTTRALRIQSAVPHRRWRIAFLLGVGVLVNYFDRVNLSVSHNALVQSFGITDVIFGYLSSAYSFTYAALQLPIGVILDKLGVRRVGRIGIFLWSCASFGAAITPTLHGLFGARFLLGIGEAPTFPANAKAIGHWFPHHERSFATACFDAAAKLASAVGIPLMGFVLLWAGWRWSFALTGFISLAYFLLFWRVYREPLEDPLLTETEREYIDCSEASNDTGAQSAKEHSLFYLLTVPKVMGLALGSGAYNYVFYLLLTWLPTYLSTSLHIDLLHSFIYTSVPWLIATTTDLLIGGMMVDFFVRRGANGSRIRRIILIAGTAFGLGIFGAAHAPSAAYALFWISLSIGGLAAAAPVMWSLPSFIASRPNVGKVGGIINFAGQISGICAPIITGYVVQTQHSYALAFIIPAAYLLIGIGGYIFLLGRIELAA
jgi:sugar phosphate permease